MSDPSNTLGDTRRGERLLVVVGPTASGKTELAMELASRHHGEIVSADSVQVYRHFDLGTGKPSREDLARAPHHLIDVVEPDEPMDAAEWARRADAALAEIRGRGHVPIVCGGTFLWVRALLWGLAPAPPASPEIRRRHQDDAARDGRAALHAELAKIDPESAARLASNDLVRVSRALEVHELTGVPMSQWQREHGFREVRHAFRLVGIARQGSDLDERIAARVRAMLGRGWIEEVRALVARGLGESRAMGSVGYKQIASALASGEPIDGESLFELIRRATRVFARRQRTWLRDRDVVWVSPGRALEEAEAVWLPGAS